MLSEGAEVVVKHTIAQACVTYEWRVKALEVMDDHVHLFVQIPHTEAPVAVARTLKSLTALAVFTQFPEIKKQRFWGSGLWSAGTFYSTVGQISQDTVLKYIESQKSHK